MCLRGVFEIVFSIPPNPQKNFRMNVWQLQFVSFINLMGDTAEEAELFYTPSGRDRQEVQGSPFQFIFQKVLSEIGVPEGSVVSLSILSFPFFRRRPFRCFSDSFFFLFLGGVLSVLGRRLKGHW